MRELVESLLLRLDEFLAPLASLLATGNLCIHPRDELVAILPLTAQHSPIEQVGTLPIAGDGQMRLAQVDACGVLGSALLQRLVLFLWHTLSHLIGSDGLVLSPGPVDHHGFGSLPFPEEHERGIGATIREKQQRVFEGDGAGFVLNAEIPLAVARRPGVGVRLAPFSPTGERGNKGLHTGIGRMRMQRVAGKEAHKMFRFEPDALVMHGAPEKDQRTAIKVAAGMRKLIKLLCSAEMHTAYAIVHVGLLLVFSHTGLFFLIWLQPEAMGSSPRQTRLSTGATSPVAAAVSTFVLIHGIFLTRLISLYPQ